VVVALVSAGAAATGSHARRPWCDAGPNVAWRRVLSRHVVALSRTTSLVPVALARDGHSFFAEMYSAEFSGVVRIDAMTSAVHRIKAFPDPDYDQAWGAFDGRWLVWNEYHGFDSFNDFTTWAWDTHTQKLREIGAARRRPDGRFWASPWRGADVRNGIATWVEGVGPDQLGEVHAYNLRTSRDLVVRHGHPGGAFLLDRDLIVWAEASAPGAPTKMHAASARTGKRFPVPRALRSLRNVTGLQTDGRRIAYPSGSYESLWWASAASAEPRKVVGTRRLDHIDNSVQVGGRYVGFGISPRVFVAEPRVRRYVEVGNHGGLVYVDPTALLVSQGPTKKVLHPVVHVAFVRLRDLPRMPACS
jgi:hypothetical protein